MGSTPTSTTSLIDGRAETENSVTHIESSVKETLSGFDSHNAPSSVKLFTLGFRIMAITLVSETRYTGSIPVAPATFRLTFYKHTL